MKKQQNPVIEREKNGESYEKLTRKNSQKVTRPKPKKYRRRERKIKGYAKGEAERERRRRDLYFLYCKKCTLLPSLSTR